MAALTHYQRLAFLLALLGLLFVCLPVKEANSTVDSLAYATEARYGLDMWSSHHLLYTPALWRFGRLFGLEDTLALGKVLNALAAILALALFYRVLKRKGCSANYALTATGFCGAAFGVARFATENEAYIWPLIPSLLAWLAFTNRRYASAGVWLGFAVCFHQLQVLWLAAFTVDMLIKRQGKPVLHMAVAALGIIALVYFQVVVNTKSLLQNPWNFLAGEFASGGVKTDVGIHYLVLWVASIMRTFVQVHGIMAAEIKMQAFKWFVAVSAGVGAIFYALTRVKFPAANKIKVYTSEAIWLAMLLALFSLLSQGNAEFLVGLPFALAVGLANAKMWQNGLPFLASLMIAWNVTFGLLPLSLCTWYPDQVLSNRVKKENSTAFFIENKLKADWHYAYRNDFTFPKNTYHKSWAEFKGNVLHYNHNLFEPNGYNRYCLEENKTKWISRAEMLEKSGINTNQNSPIFTKTLAEKYIGDTTTLSIINYY